MKMIAPNVEFTEETRAKLAVYVGIAHWICILPSFICLFSALFIQLQIEDKISFIENYNGTALPGMLIFTGFFGFIAHILCGKASFSNRLPEKREKWMRYLMPTVITTAIIFLFEFISGIMCFAHIKNLEDAFNDGIKTSMAAYKNDIATKIQMDVLQMTMECCGSSSYTDWFYLPWVHPDYMDPVELKSISNANLGANFVGDNVPFSCCTSHIVRPCINHYVHNNEAHVKYDYRKSLTLHNTGCTAKLMEYYKNSVLTWAGALVLTLSFIQLALVVGGRFLQTSIETLSSPEDTGPSMGFLFKPPGPGQDFDTTITSTEGEPLLDKTDDTTTTQNTENPYNMSMYDDTFDEPMYENIPPVEPMYENIPPFDIAPMDESPMQEAPLEEDHIYREGEVEAYLAANFKNSREKFEAMTAPQDEPIYDNIEEPVYENVPVSGFQEADYEMPLSSVPPPPPSPPKSNPNYGSYMDMNISNSSVLGERAKHRIKIHHRDTPLHRRPPSSWSQQVPHKYPYLSRKSFQSPVSRKRHPAETHVIKMGSSASSPELAKRTSIPRQGEYTPFRKAYSGDSHQQNPFIGRKTQYSPHKAATSTPRRNLSPQLLLSPRHYRTESWPVMTLPAYFQRRTKTKGRSPRMSVSPPKTTFQIGSSYGCYHAID